MKPSKIMPRLTLLLLLLLLFEVVALHLNRLPLMLVAKEIHAEEDGSRWLVCELRNDRITPIRYLAVSDDFPAYEVVRDRHTDLQTWCTSDFDHSVMPFSRVTLRMPVPKSGLKDCRISVICTGTSLLSWLLWPSSYDERASVWFEDEVIQNE
jgi:hypothetical protein